MPTRSTGEVLSFTVVGLEFNLPFESYIRVSVRNNIFTFFCFE